MTLKDYWDEECTHCGKKRIEHDASPIYPYRFCAHSLQGFEPKGQMTLAERYGEITIK